MARLERAQRDDASGGVIVGAKQQRRLVDRGLKPRIVAQQAVEAEPAEIERAEVAMGDQLHHGAPGRGRLHQAMSREPMLLPQ